MINSKTLINRDFYVEYTYVKVSSIDKFQNLLMEILFLDFNVEGNLGKKERGEDKRSSFQLINSKTLINRDFNVDRK